MNYPASVFCGGIQSVRPLLDRRWRGAEVEELVLQELAPGSDAGYRQQHDHGKDPCRQPAGRRASRRRSVRAIVHAPSAHTPSSWAHRSGKLSRRRIKLASAPLTSTSAGWAALLERPENIPAKFNYEWALERIEEAPPEQDPRPNPREDSELPEIKSDERKPSPQADPSARDRAEVDPAEARRWLDTLNESVSEPLRLQFTESHRGRKEQTW